MSKSAYGGKAKAGEDLKVVDNRVQVTVRSP